MPIASITPEEAQRLLTGSTAATLLDVRTAAEFAQVHAAGARSLPLDQLEPESVKSVCKGKTGQLLVICKSGARAAKAIQKLQSAGMTDVLCVTGGTDAWVSAGLPVERSDRRVISLERQVRIAAGLLVSIGIAMSLLVHPAFIGLSAFVGLGLIFAGVTDWCGMGMLIARLPWNR